MHHPTMRPVVLIVGGFITSPFLYLPLRRRLLARGAATVAIAPIWTFDWIRAAAVGLAPLVRRTATAIRRTRAQADEPIIVVGHSAGGVLARLATSPMPDRGEPQAVVAVAELIGTLVTLGSPHVVQAEPWRGQRAGADASRFLEATVPGAFFSPRTQYLSVASRAMQGRAGWLPDRRVRAGHAYRSLLGAQGGDAFGDGLVPFEAGHLPGARQVSLDTALHGHLGRGWYGDTPALDVWWPAALEAWREALEARAVKAQQDLVR